MPAFFSKPAQRVFERDFRGPVVGFVRILVGTMWLVNVAWKTPSNFGARDGSGLNGYVRHAVDNEVFAPWAWLVKHVVLQNFGIFGWITLITEVLLAALLLAGWKTTWVALVGAMQSAAIGLSVARTPNEWPWSYFLMFGVHLLLAVSAAGSHWGCDQDFSVERVRRRVALGTSAVLAVVSAWAWFRVDSSGSTFAPIDRLELGLLRATPTGAAVLFVFAVVAVVVVGLRRYELLAVPGVGALVLAVATLAVWREGDHYVLNFGYDGRVAAILLAFGIVCILSSGATKTALAKPKPVVLKV